MFKYAYIAKLAALSPYRKLFVLGNVRNSALERLKEYKRIADEAARRNDYETFRQMVQKIKKTSQELESVKRRQVHIANPLYKKNLKLSALRLKRTMQRNALNNTEKAKELSPVKETAPQVGPEVKPQTQAQPQPQKQLKLNSLKEQTPAKQHTYKQRQPQQAQPAASTSNSLYQHANRVIARALGIPIYSEPAPALATIRHG